MTKTECTEVQNPAMWQASHLSDSFEYIVSVSQKLTVVSFIWVLVLSLQALLNGFLFFHNPATFSYTCTS